MKVKGLFSFKDESEITFGDKNLIIGPNNSGKSNILQLFDVLKTALINYHEVKMDVKYDDNSDWSKLEAIVKLNIHECELL